MNEREKLKEELLEELKNEYVLTPIKESHVSVKDILNKYLPEICQKINVNHSYTEQDRISNAIRVVMCLHFGVRTTKEIKNTKDKSTYRAETERFIKEYILDDKNIIKTK